MTRIALVTGANRGLGRATALALARNKINVVAASRGGAGEVVDEILEMGGESFAVQLDVADLSSIEAARAAVLAGIRQEWNARTIDVLVNNAGVGLFAPLGAITAEDFDTTFAVNVRGPLFVIQAFLPHLSEEASIVNVSSSLSRHVSPATSVYAASKKALEALTRASPSNWVRGVSGSIRSPPDRPQPTSTVEPCATAKTCAPRCPAKPLSGGWATQRTSRTPSLPWRPTSSAGQQVSASRCPVECCCNG